MNQRYQIFGKCILAGEHAVLRGGTALVLPVRSRSLTFHVTESTELEFSVSGENADDYALVLPGLIDRALETSAKRRDDLKFRVQVESSLPIGMGLGASAVICVFVSRWFADLGWHASDDIYEYARQLENIFHGESSGVDIACSLFGEGVSFQRDSGAQPLNMSWAPTLYLTYSGQRGLTAECVDRVKKLFEKDPERARGLDVAMSDSVSGIQRALGMSSDQGQILFVDSIKKANHIFEEWELTTPLMREKAQWLRDHGAVSVKPTGSGGGGYMLSVWDKSPPEAVQDVSIRV